MPLPLSDKRSCFDIWAEIWVGIQVFSPREIHSLCSQQVAGSKLNSCSSPSALVNLFSISLCNADAMKYLFSLLSFAHIKPSFWSTSAIPLAVASGTCRNLRDTAHQPSLRSWSPSLRAQLRVRHSRPDSVTETRQNSTRQHQSPSQNHYSYLFPLISWDPNPLHQPDLNC